VVKEAIREAIAAARKNGNQIKVAVVAAEVAPAPAAATPEVGVAEALGTPGLATGRPREIPVPDLRPEMPPPETEPLPEIPQLGTGPLLEMPELAIDRPRQVRVPASQVEVAGVADPAHLPLQVVPRAAVAAARLEVPVAAGPAPAVRVVEVDPAAEVVVAVAGEEVVVDEHQFSTQTIFHPAYENP